MDFTAVLLELITAHAAAIRSIALTSERTIATGKRVRFGCRKRTLVTHDGS